MDRIGPFLSREERKRQAEAAIKLVGLDYLSDQDHDQISRLLFLDDMTMNEYGSKKETERRFKGRMDEIREGIKLQKEALEESRQKDLKASPRRPQMEMASPAKDPAPISCVMEKERPAPKELSVDDINAMLLEAGM